MALDCGNLMTALFPENEAQRIQKLLSYGILDTQREPAYDDLAALASRICNTPIALISLIDRHRQWFKSTVGLNICETERETAFCAHAILTSDVLIIPDTQHDQRFVNNPLVLRSPFIRFYAGAPLMTADGFALGTLCVIDTVPRQLNDDQIHALQVLSRQAVTQMELHLNLFNLSRNMVELWQTNQALEESQALVQNQQHLLQTILHTLPQGIAWKDTAGTYQGCNPKFAELAQLPSAQAVIGKREIDMPWYGDRIQINETDRQILELGYELHHLVESIPQPDNSLIWVETNKVPLKSEGAVTGILYTFENITERQQAEQALQHSEAKNRAILSAIPDLIVLVGIDGLFLDVIKSHTLYDLVPEGVDRIGRSIFDVLPNAIAERQMTAIYQSLLTQTMQMYEQEVYINDQLQYEEVRVVPYDTYTALLMIRNVSDRKQLELQLKQAKEAAEAANRAKSEFLANMSHELRTPLNAILGFAQVMNLDSSLPANHAEEVNIILDNGNHLLSLINSVLDLSKIEAGQMSSVNSTFNLVELLQSVHKMLYQQAIAKELYFDIDLASNVPQQICTDRQKLCQVLINLLNNSIKFTLEGGVMLRVSVVDSPYAPLIDSATQTVVDCSPDTPQATLCFEIRDTGIGIDPVDQTRIFNAFEQTEVSKRSFNGTGLGLTLSQRFIHLLGGNFTLDSEPGQGTTFTIFLPVQIAASNHPSAPQHTVVGLAPHQPKHRILVVDDQPENRKFLVELLTRVGFDVQEAEDGQLAVQTWWRWQPNLILMDMRMPKTDGYEASRRIRAFEQIQGRTKPQVESLNPKEPQFTTIIAVTANVFSEQRSQVFEAGCDDIIFKPFQVHQLFETIARHLNVQYLYSATPVAINSQHAKRATQSEPHILRPSDLDMMPQYWRTAFSQAIIRLNDAECLRLIGQIPDDYADLSHTLAQLVNHFRFDILSTLKQDETLHS